MEVPMVGLHSASLALDLVGHHRLRVVLSALNLGCPVGSRLACD